MDIMQDVFKHKEKKKRERTTLGSAEDCCKAEVLVLSPCGADESGQRQDCDMREQMREIQCMKWKVQNNSQ